MTKTKELFDFDGEKNFTSWSADKEANVWATFYLTFNDDNVEKMYNSFYTCFKDIDFTKPMTENGKAVQIVHDANVEWCASLKVLYTAFLMRTFWLLCRTQSRTLKN